MKRRILEIGPGPMPLHNRRDDDDNRLVLKDDESYTAIETPHFVKKNLPKSEFWKQAKEKYGDRVHIVEGDRADLSNIPDASIDELVALGTTAEKGEVVAEFVRVLAPGGILRLGIGASKEKNLKMWKIRLPQLGFIELKEERQEYDHASKFENTRPPFPYVVVSFQKGKNR